MGAIFDVVTAVGVTTAATDFGEKSVARVSEGDTVAAAAGTDWSFNTVRKSAAGAGLLALAGISDLRCIAGGVYVACDAVLNVGMT